MVQEKKKTKGEINKLKNTVSVIVMLSMIAMLFISVIAEIFVPTYKTNPLFYGLIGAIGGLFFNSLNK